MHIDTSSRSANNEAEDEMIMSDPKKEKKEASGKAPKDKQHKAVSVSKNQDKASKVEADKKAEGAKKEKHQAEQQAAKVEGDKKAPKEDSKKSMSVSRPHDKASKADMDKKAQ